MSTRPHLSQKNWRSRPQGRKRCELRCAIPCSAPGNVDGLLTTKAEGGDSPRPTDLRLQNITQQRWQNSAVISLPDNAQRGCEVTVRFTIITESQEEDLTIHYADRRKLDECFMTIKSWVWIMCLYESLLKPGTHLYHMMGQYVAGLSYFVAVRYRGEKACFCQDSGVCVEIYVHRLENCLFRAGGRAPSDSKGATDYGQRCTENSSWHHEGIE